MTSLHVKKLTKNVGLCSNNYTICFKKIVYSLSRLGEACTDKIEAGKTPSSVSLRSVRHFWILENEIADSAQCYSLRRV